MSAIDKAFSDISRSYVAAKSAVGQISQEMLAGGPSGILTQRSDLSKASEQLQHFRGWVYASIRPIAQKIAGQQIHVGKIKSSRIKTKGINPDPLESHPILDLLADPNQLMVAWSLMFSTVASLELTGRQLWWLPDQKEIHTIPTSWLVGFEGSTSFQSFSIRPPGHAERIELPSDQCCYFSYPNPADPHGVVSPLQAVAGAVDSDEAIETSRIACFRNGIHPVHTVKVGKDANGVRRRLTPEQQRQIIDAIKRRYTDVYRHGEPLILDNLIEEVTRLSNTPAEMDWLASEKSTKSRIVQGFGTNPIILGEIEGANRASATVADRHFVDYCINPKIELLSQCLTEWLSPMFGGGLKIWIEPCKANDAELSLKWADNLAKYGAITAGELRKLSPFDLAEDEKFDAVPIGRNRTSQIENGIRGLIQDEIETVESEKNLGRSRIPASSGNGK